MGKNRCRVFQALENGTAGWRRMTGRFLPIYLLALDTLWFAAYGKDFGRKEA
jgi:hypothetical protein